MKAAIREELAAFKRKVGKVDAEIVAAVESGQRSLFELGLCWPGGDVCPSLVVRGLATLLPRLGEPTSAAERAAIVWLEMWVDAGAAMLPRPDAKGETR